MAAAELDGDIIRVSCGYVDNDRMLQVPGARHDRSTDTWKVPLSWASCKVLRGVFGNDLEIGSELKKWSWNHWTYRIEPCMKLRDLTELPEYYEPAWQFDHIEKDSDLKLKPYQRADVAFLATAGQALLANEMGTGKTASVIRTLQVLSLANCEPFPALIICPNSLKITVWQRELTKWAPELTVTVVEGGAAARRKQLAEPADVYVINWDLLRYHSKLAQYGQEALTDSQRQPKELNGMGLRTVVADECVTSDTMVRTPSGLTEICNIREGDFVRGVDHATGRSVWSQVTGVRRSPLRRVVKIGKLKISEDHPVWLSSEGGLCYDNHYGLETENVYLQAMRERIYCTQPTIATSNILLGVMPVEVSRKPSAYQTEIVSANEAADAATRNSGKNARISGEFSQPVPESGNPDQSTRNPESWWIQESQWRQRHGSYHPANKIARISRQFLENRVSSSWMGENSWVSDKLQARSGRSGIETRNRSSWSWSREDSRTRNFQRQEKESFSRGTWLDDTLDLERGNSERYLWNLETATGNYFADGILVHNCHRAIHPKSQQTRAAWAVMAEAHYRFALTGTPVTDHVGDLYGILHGILPDWFPGKTRYMERYALTTWGLFGGLEIIGLRPDTVDEFRAITEPVMRRVLKAAVLPQLPARLPDAYRYTPMTPKQAKAYREMADEMIAHLDDEVLVAPDPLVKFMRLMQFAAASAEIVDDRVRLSDPSGKVDDLIELLEELGEDPLVVVAVSRQLIELAAARLEKESISHCLITGAVSPGERDIAQAEFQDGKRRVILLTLGTGAEGLTLTKASRILFMQESWRVLENDQAAARIDRIGSEIHDSIQVIKQITPGTVEEAKIQVLEGKMERIEEIMRDRAVLEKLLGAGEKKGRKP